MSIACPQEEQTTKNPRTCSEARLRANRLNAQRSTGPRTAEGKQKSSQNAQKHGLCSTSALLPGEDQATYHLFEDELREDLQPRTALQNHLFTDIARHLWKLRRLPDAERELFSLEGQHEDLPACKLLAQAFHTNPTKNPFLLLNRYERSLHNAFLRLLSKYHQLQKQPLPLEEEIVPRELALPYPNEPIQTYPNPEETRAAVQESPSNTSSTPRAPTERTQPAPSPSCSHSCRFVANPPSSTFGSPPTPPAAMTARIAYPRHFAPTASLITPEPSTTSARK